MNKIHGKNCRHALFMLAAAIAVFSLASGGALGDIISSGAWHTCGLLANGSVLCWGNNCWGQLGDGTYYHRANPVPLNRSYSFVSISAGGMSTCGLLANGSIMCWGAGEFGQLGDGTTVTKPWPVAVKGENFTQVSVGGRHACGLLANGSIMCWGESWGATPRYAVTPGTIKFKQVAAGPGYLNYNPYSPQITYGLMENGFVMGWRDPLAFYYVNTISAYKMIDLNVLWDWVYFHACGVLNNGSIMCWGNNVEGQLGDGTTTDRVNQPRELVFLSVARPNPPVFGSVDSGAMHACGVLANGSIMCWGYNYRGQLGDGTWTDRWNPRFVASPLNFIAVSGGFYHTCGLVNDTSIRCWGSNGYGQSGNGLTGGQTSCCYSLPYSCWAGLADPYPQPVKTTSGDIMYGFGLPDEPPDELLVSILITNSSPPGRFHVSPSGMNYAGIRDVSVEVLAVDVGGSGLKECRYYELGTAPPAWDIINCNTTDIVQLTAGGGRKDIIFEARDMFLNYQNTTASVTFDITPPSTSLYFPAAGSWQHNGFSVFISDADADAGLGACYYRVLSNGMVTRGWTVRECNSPVDVTVGNGLYDCRDEGVDKCTVQAYTTDKVLNFGSVVSSSYSINLSANISFSSGFIDVSAGGNHTCGLLANGSLMCWGRNTEGQLGDGTGADSSGPVFVNSTLTFSSVYTGGYHTCGLLTNGSIMCWGRNTEGQLGDGTTSGRFNPVFVNTARTFESASAGREHTCGLLANGSIMCWGKNNNGQLGDGTTTGRLNPTFVNSTKTFEYVEAGTGHTCGLLANGSIMCWGDNADGELGAPPAGERWIPSPVNSTGIFTSVSSGGWHTCSLLLNHSLMCWGKNNNGQLGDGTTSGRFNPVFVNTARTFESASAGREHTCGLLANGSLMCWGRNTEGQLGDGTKTGRLNPVPAKPQDVFVLVSAGDTHTCGLMPGGSILCWGGNDSGQIGNGNITPPYIPPPLPGEPPNATAGAADQSGTSIDDYQSVEPAEITTVTLTATAWDNNIGLSNNWLKVWITRNGMETYNETDCCDSSSCAAGAVSTCNATFAYGPGVRIKYMATARNSDGRMKETAMHYASKRDFASFLLAPRFIMAIGDEALLQISVKNNREKQDNITLKISGYGYMTFMETSGVHVTAADGRTAVVETEGDSEIQVFAKALSTSLGDYQLQIYSQSLLGKWGAACGGPVSCVNETSDMELIVGYPPEFPDAGIPAMVLLALSAALVFAFLPRNGRHAAA